MADLLGDKTKSIMKGHETEEFNEYLRIESGADPMHKARRMSLVEVIRRQCLKILKDSK